MAQESDFSGFDKNVIHSYVFFFFYLYESTNGLPTFCQNHMYGKNLALDL